MELKQLENFVRIAELGSFSRAAMVLDVAQPALSRQIRALEVELRQNLFHRNGRGVTPTEAGKALLGHARAVIHQLELAREELGRIGQQQSGHVSVGAPPGIAKVLMLPLTREFRSRMPNAQLSIIEGSTVAMQELLVSGRLDMALLYNSGLLTELDIVPLRDEPLYLVGLQRPPAVDGDGDGDSAAADAPIALREVAALPLIIPARPGAIRMLVESQMVSLGLRPRIAFEIEGVAAILNVVRDGAGYAVLPLSSVQATGHAEAFSLRRVCKPEMACHLALATSSRRALTLTQLALRDLLLDVVRRTLPDVAAPAAMPESHSY